MAARMQCPLPIFPSLSVCCAIARVGPPLVRGAIGYRTFSWFVSKEVGT
jgi:hypothetical protein